MAKRNREEKALGLELVQGGNVELVGMVVRIGKTLVFMTAAAFEQLKYRL